MPRSVGDVFVCDFEEQNDRDFDGWPDGWTRRRSRELPEFVRVGIVTERADAEIGRGRVRLRLRRTERPRFRWLAGRLDSPSLARVTRIRAGRDRYGASRCRDRSGTCSSATSKNRTTAISMAGRTAGLAVARASYPNSCG